MTAPTRGTAALRRIDDVLFGPEAPARLFAVQALFLVLIGVRTVLSPYPLLSPAPPVLFKAVPIVSFLDRQPPRGVIVAIQAIVVVAVITWFWVGKYPNRRAQVRRVAFAVAWLAFLALAAFRASRGKIFHIELLLVWGSLPLVFAPGDATWADRRPQRRTGWPIRSAIGVIATIYCLTGVWKLRNSGIDWVFSENMKWSLAWGRVRGEPPPWQDLGVFIADHLWMSQVAAGFILLFELTFPVVLFFKRVRPVYVVAAWMFHVGTFLLLGLDYMVWLCTVTILLIDWPRVADRLQALARDRPHAARGDGSSSGPSEVEAAALSSSRE